MSQSGNGRSDFAEAPGDVLGKGLGAIKAGPAEVLLIAGNVPARGQPDQTSEKP